MKVVRPEKPEQSRREQAEDREAEGGNSGVGRKGRLLDTLEAGNTNLFVCLLRRDQFPFPVTFFGCKCTGWSAAT